MPRRTDGTLPSSKTWKVLLDMVPLLVVPKTVAPLEAQDALETRKVWDSVSQALLAKDYTTASKNKQSLEQDQRDLADARKKAGEVYTPAFFEPEAEGDKWDGRPRLNEKGRSKVEQQFKQ